MPIHLLFSPRFRSSSNWKGEDLPLALGSPMQSGNASSYGLAVVRRRHPVHSASCLGLATQPPHLPSWLQSLRSSRLSPDVSAFAIATMNRSDSSQAPEPLAIWLRFRKRVSASHGVCEVSLGHARHCSHHPGVNHTVESCAGLRPLGEARPPTMPNHVHSRSGLMFGYDPSPGSLTASGCLLLRE
jgi:hypothetical protein